MLWIVNLITGFLLCVISAGYMIPKILLISFRRRLFDEPDERKIHTSTVPRLGGIAFVPVIFFTIALLLGVNLYFGYTGLLHQLLFNVNNIAFGFCALLMLYVVGMADDLIGIKYRAKFFVQIVCAIMLIIGGIDIDNFHGFLGLYEIPTIVSWITSIGLAVFIINAFNLIDGIDGLASGLSSVAAVFYGVIFYLMGEYLYALISITCLGVLVPFFYFNVFGDPEKHKKIFMGDTGSLSIGLILSILSFKMMNTTETVGILDMNILVATVSPLVIPCFDVIRVFFVRIKSGHSPFLPDKNHIHHRLLAMGLSQRVSMILIVSSSILFTLFNIILSMWLNVNIIILIDALVFFVVIHFLRPRLRNIKIKN